MKFSILIPAYKKKYFEECLDSCLNQSFKDFEIIIVDDCSPEDLFSVVKRKVDSRIHYFRNNKRCGIINVVDNWNICLSYCKGDYVICMGDDDKLPYNSLMDISRTIDKFPDLGLYHSRTEIIDENSNVVDIQEHRPDIESALSLAWHRWNGRKYQFIGDFVFETQLLRQNGGFYKLPMAWGSDDISAIIAAAERGVANTQTVCFQYRSNSQTISSTGGQIPKIHAALEEKQWFLSYIENQKKEQLSVSDSTYVYLLERNLVGHFVNKFKDLIIKDMSRNPFNFFHWIKEAGLFGLKKKQILKFLLVAIKNNISKVW